jgi:hypothetical protein
MVSGIQRLSIILAYVSQTFENSGSILGAESSRRNLAQAPGKLDELSEWSDMRPKASLIDCVSSGGKGDSADSLLTTVDNPKPCTWLLTMLRSLAHTKPLFNLRVFDLFDG